LAALDNLKVDPGIAGQFFWWSAQKNLDINSAVGQVPGDDKTIAAVVALATANEPPAMDTQAQEQLRSSATGVLHENHAGNAVVLNGPAIQVAHL
jgi:hypothetical protein